MLQVQYSTLSEYFNAIAAQDVNWNVWPAQDWFPYYDVTAAWWTGYYTSRNALKGYLRSRENVLRTAELLHVLTSQPLGPRRSNPDFVPLEALRKASGEATHHDAVSGTAEPRVVKMYDEHLMNGSNLVAPLIEEALSVLGQAGQPIPDLSLNASSLHILLTDSDATVSIVVFNPTSWPLSQFVAVPCFQTNLIVMSHTGAAVAFDVLPSNVTSPGTCQVAGTCGHPEVVTPYVLHFAVSIGAIGYETYFVSVNTSAGPTEATYSVSSDVTNVSNGLVEVVFDGSTHLLSQVSLLTSSISVEVSQNFFEYDESTDFHLKEAPGGAYILHPKGPASPVVTSPYSYEVVQGRYVTEVRQRFTMPCNQTIDDGPLLISCGIEQTYRLVQGSIAVEILTSVGPLQNNKDFVSRYSTSLSTDGVFYTDDNCFDTHQRTLNDSITNPIGGNYYPMTCAGSLYDSTQDVQLTFLGDRTHGGTSQASGEFEIMYHRRSFSTDGRGILDLEVCF